MIHLIKLGILKAELLIRRQQESGDPRPRRLPQELSVEIYAVVPDDAAGGDILHSNVLFAKDNGGITTAKSRGRLETIVQRRSLESGAHLQWIRYPIDLISRAWQYKVFPHR